MSVPWIRIRVERRRVEQPGRAGRAAHARPVRALAARLLAVSVVLAALAAAPAARAARLTGIRIGEHADFTRIVFDLDEGVNHHLDRADLAEAHELVLALDADATRRVLASDARFLRSITIEPTDAGTLARVIVDSGALEPRILVLREPDRIVLDLHAKPRTRRAAAEPSRPTRAEPRRTASATPAPDAGPAETTPAIGAAAEAAAEAAVEAAQDAAAGEEQRIAAATAGGAGAAAAETPRPGGPGGEEAAGASAAAEGSAAKPTEAEAEAQQLAAGLGNAAAEQAARADAEPQPPAQAETPASPQRAPAARGAEARARATARPPVRPARAPAGQSEPSLLDRLNLAYVVAGALAVALLVAVPVMLARRRREDRELGEPLDLHPDAAIGASRPSDLVAGGPEAAVLPEEEKPEPETIAPPADEELPTPAARRSAAAAAVGPGPAAPSPNLDRQVGEMARRVEHLETRLEEVIDARDRLERQLAAQAEELRVQRAAIARAQRVLRTLARPEEAAAEPAAPRDS